MIVQGSYFSTNVLAVAHFLYSHRTATSECDHAFDSYTFQNSITVDFGPNHNHLLEDDDAMKSFASVARLWFNEQSMCNETLENDVYWDFLFDTKEKGEKEYRSRRINSGTGNGRCLGRDCPRRYVVTYPVTNTSVLRKHDPCDKTLLDALKETNLFLFDDVDHLSVDLSNGDERQHYCPPNVTETSPQRSAVKEVLTALGTTHTLETDYHECFHVGVGCWDEALTVNEIMFRHKHLNGTVSTEIGRIPNLEGLVLHSNKLKGPLPSEIGNLSNLGDMYLHRNNFNEQLPTEIGQLSNLETMYLHSNDFEGTLPSEIGQLSNLFDLLLHNNSFTGQLPTEIGQLSNLNYLSLSFNEFDGPLPSDFGKLLNLVDLSLHENNLSGRLPTEIGKLSNLWALSLSSNGFHGPLPSEIGNLSDLWILHLYDNDLSGLLPTEIGQLSNLRSLWLDENNFSGRLPTELGRLSNLQYLWIDGNDFIGPLPSEIGLLDNLEGLYLDSHLCDETLSAKLKEITTCVFRTEPTIDSLLESSSHKMWTKLLLWSMSFLCSAAVFVQ